MIKYYIQNNLNAIVMKTFYQLLQFRSLMIVFLRCRIAAVWCKKTNRIVSPVIQKSFSIYLSGIHSFIKLKNRHQLYCIDSQLLQVGDFLLQSGKGSLLTHTRGRMLCKSTYMQFVNYQLVQFLF